MYSRAIWRYGVSAATVALSPVAPPPPPPPHAVESTSAAQAAIPVVRMRAFTMSLLLLLWQCLHNRTAPLSEACEGNRRQQRQPVEQRLDEKCPSELLNPRNANAQDQDADDRAPYVDAAGPDRRRSEKCAHERRQQVVETDIRLPNLQLRREDAAREPDQDTRGHEHPDDVGANRNPVQRRRFLVGTNRVDVAPER